MKRTHTFNISARLKQRRWQYAFLGVCLSFTGPMGEWIFVKLFSEYIKNFFFLTLFYAELSTLIVFSLFGYIIGKYAEKIETLAFHDKLTGLYNRHYLMEQLNELLALHKRYQERFCLIMMDLDHFKRVNDSYGHSVGDKTLKAVGVCITKEIRETDFGSRYGGEEFIVVCPHTSIIDSYKLAERIRMAIAGLTADSLGFPGPQTISAGVYEVPSDKRVSLQQILDHADQALYRAKQEGRNKVAIYNPESI